MDPTKADDGIRIVLSNPIHVFKGNIGFGGGTQLRFAHGFKICARSGDRLAYYKYGGV